MHRSQRGVALVEAILAIVLLGIVVVTALGQFDDPSDGTTAAVYRNVDAKISSAAAINYTARILDSSTKVALKSGDDCANSRFDAAFSSDYDASVHGAEGTGFNCR